MFTRVRLIAAVGLAAFATVAFAGSVFVGPLVLVEQYAPGVDSTGSPTCFVAVARAQVTSPASCAANGAKYYYAWNCEDPKRKNFLAMAMAAYVAEKKVQLIGTGQCSPHPNYEGLDYFVISESP
jgi:hypothetical protein